MNKKNLYISTVLFFTFAGCNSQSIRLLLKSNDSIENTVMKSSISPFRFSTKELLDKELRTIHENFKLEGYLESSYKLLKKNDSLYSANFSLGNHYDKITISFKKKLNLKKFTTYHKQNIKNNRIRIHYKDVESFLNELTSHYNELGNAMVKVSLKNITINNSEVYADLVIKKNNTRYIDKFVIKGYDRFPKSIHKNILDPFLKKPFNKTTIATISNSIKILNFVEEIKKPAVLFTKDSTLLYIYLKKKLSNQLDGQIGFNTKKSGKGLEINGNFDLQLTNIFHKGEVLNLKWLSNSITKKLTITSKIPFIFKTPLTTEFNLLLFNKVNSFIQIKPILNFNYVLNSSHNILSKISFEKSSIISETGEIANLRNYTSYFYGLGYHLKKKLNSNNVYHAKLLVEVGTRQENLNTNNQQRLYFESTYNYLFNNKSSVSIKTLNGKLFSNNYLTNELLRLGGRNNLRGFQEESINASAYSIFNTEFRYKTNKTSYIYSISDLGFYENILNNTKSNLLGLGVGYAFSAKNSLINISYAIGKHGKNPFNVKKALIHVGIISFF